MNRTKLGKQADLVKEGMLESDKKWEAYVATLKEEHAMELDAQWLRVLTKADEKNKIIRSLTYKLIEKRRVEWYKLFLLQIAATIIGVLSVYVIVNL